MTTKKKKTEWCLKEPKHKGWLGWEKDYLAGTIHSTKLRKAPKRVICQNCKKRFKPLVQECGDDGCWHFYVPAHKKTKIYKKPSKRQ